MVSTQLVLNYIGDASNLLVIRQQTHRATSTYQFGTNCRFLSSYDSIFVPRLV